MNVTDLKISWELDPTWRNCKRCGLHRFRRNVVYGRGRLPAPYLFIGEAPGPSEDLRKVAFIGMAGKIFDKGRQMAARRAGLHSSPRFYVTNVVGCLPHDSLHAKFRAPHADEIAACMPRLAATVRIVKAKHVILLGKVAEKACKKLCPDGLALRHPSYLQRTGGVEGPEFSRWVCGLAELFEETCRPEWLEKERKVL